MYFSNVNVCIFIESHIVPVELGIVIPFTKLCEDKFIKSYHISTYRDILKYHRESQNRIINRPVAVRKKFVEKGLGTLLDQLMQSYELFVFYRACGNIAYHELFKKLKNRSKKVVYLTDDDLSLLSDHPRYSSFKPHIHVPVYLQDADLVGVYSDYLYEKYKCYNPSIVKLNSPSNVEYIDQIRSIIKPIIHPFTIVLGYSAAAHHRNHFNLCKDALYHILQKYDHVRLELFFDPEDSRFTSSHKVYIARPVTSGVNSFYQYLLKRNWDIGIAPLADTEFNRAKTSVKYREYSALRIAGVYSNIVTYNKDVTHKQTGVLTENTTDAWVEALESLINDQNLRQTIITNAHQDAHNRFSLSQFVESYKQALLTVMR